MNSSLCNINSSSSSSSPQFKFYAFAKLLKKINEKFKHSTKHTLTIFLDLQCNNAFIDSLLKNT